MVALQSGSSAQMRKGWSIDPDDWRSLAQALEPASTWSVVMLTPNEREMVPERPGVYAICAPPPIDRPTTSRTMFSSLASPIYVGRSKSNIRSRFLAHCRSEDPDLRTAKRCYNSAYLRFWFTELLPSSVEGTEGWLIRCFGPPVNKQDGTIPGIIGSPVDA